MQVFFRCPFFYSVSLQLPRLFLLLTCLTLRVRLLSEILWRNTPSFIIPLLMFFWRNVPDRMRFTKHFLISLSSSPFARVVDSVSTRLIFQVIWSLPRVSTVPLSARTALRGTVLVSVSIAGSASLSESSSLFAHPMSHRVFTPLLRPLLGAGASEAFSHRVQRSGPSQSGMGIPSEIKALPQFHGAGSGMTTAIDVTSNPCWMCKS